MFKAFQRHTAEKRFELNKFNKVELKFMSGECC